MGAAEWRRISFKMKVLGIVISGMVSDFSGKSRELYFLKEKVSGADHPSKVRDPLLLKWK